MNKEIFEKEIAICQKQSQENNGQCNWGRCESCGVVPLLYKLSQNKILENKNEIKELKQEVLHLNFD